MKTMTCDQLGGACNMEFRAETFEEMAEISRKHGEEMFEKGDEAHVKVMKEMREMMKDMDVVGKWMEEKRKVFEGTPADK
jgi:predicted HAD superfamily phosphohydrolase